MDFTNLTISNLKRHVLLEKNKISNSWTFQAKGEEHIAGLNNLLNFY